MENWLISVASNILINVNNTSIIDLAKKCNVTSNCIHKAINNFKNAGLVNTKKIGRRVIVTLTDKGLVIKKHLVNIHKNL